MESYSMPWRRHPRFLSSERARRWGERLRRLARYGTDGYAPPIRRRLMIVNVAAYLVAGFTLLYPIAVLAGSILLYRSQGMVLAGLATLFYAGLLWLVRADVVPPQGLSDVPFASLSAVLFSIFVTGVACATVAVIGSYLASSLRSASEQLEEAAGQVADLQRLNQVIVSSIHSGLATTDRAGRLLYVNEYGAEILGRRPAELRRRRTSSA